MSNEFSQDPALLQEFLIESEELLEGMNQDLVALEQAPDDTELLNRIFRALHTIKGTSGFLNFDPVVRLSHRAEDVLNTLRRSEVEFSRRIMDALLAARDQLSIMLQDIREGGLKDYALDGLIAELEAVQKPPCSQPSWGHFGCGRRNRAGRTARCSSAAGPVRRNTQNWRAAGRKRPGLSN